MPQQLSLIGVMNGSLIAQFIELADIVENRSRQQEIEIQFGIVLRGQAAEITQTDDVLEQTADKSMVHHFCRRRALQPRRYRRVFNHARSKAAEPGIPDSGDVFTKAAIELLDIFRGVREIIRPIHFGWLSAPDPFHRELQPILVILYARLNLDHIIALKKSSQGLHVVPKARLDRPASVPQFQAQKRLA